MKKVLFFFLAVVLGFALVGNSVALAAGDQLLVVRKMPSQQWYFHYPYGVAVDSAGYVYVADTNNHRIQKFACDVRLAIDSLITTVEGCHLQQGLENSLVLKLQNAKNALAEDNAKKRNHAVTDLEAFINQVGGLIKAEILSPEDGQALIDLANRIIAAL